MNEPTDVERHEAMQAEFNSKRQEQLDAEWREARDAEAHTLFDEFQTTHQTAEPDPDPGQLQPDEGVATPARLAHFLEARTGLSGWIVELRGCDFIVSPPKRLVKSGLSIRKLAE